MVTLIKQSADTKASQPQVVDAFMKKLKHPLKDVAEELRSIVLSANRFVGEEIFWNAPSFFYTSKMQPFNQKDYKRFIVTFNFFKKDCIRLVFLRGAMAKSKLLEGDFKDERRLALFHDLKEVKANKKELQKIVRSLVKQIHD